MSNDLIERAGADETLVSTFDDTIMGESIRVSPNGRHVAYLCHSKEGPMLVIDTKAINGFDKIDTSNLVFSEDGEHFALQARKI
jgi:hypothetical protein